jgi:hypothetical protein
MKFKTMMESIHSEQGRKAVARSAFFGARSALLAATAQLEGLSRTITLLQDKYPERARNIRESTRFTDADVKAQAAANRAAGIHAIAEAFGKVDVDFTPTMSMPPTKDEAEQIADAAGLDVQFVLTKRAEAANRRFHAEMEASTMAEAFFYGAMEPDEDPDVRAEIALNALTRQRGFMLEWSNVDYAELVLLKHDIALMEVQGELEATKAEGSSPESPLEALCTQNSEAEVVADLNKKQIDKLVAAKLGKTKPAQRKKGVTA